MSLGILLVILLTMQADVSPLPHTHNKPHLKTLFTSQYIFWILVFFFVFFVIGVEDMTITMKMLELGASPSQIAWFYSAQALFELPLFFFGSRLMKRYGAMNLLILAIMGLSGKMFFFAATNSITVMLGLSAIQTITFPLVMMTSKNLIYTASDPNQKISGQVIGVALYGNLSGILAPLLIGSLIGFSNASGGLLILGSLLMIPLIMILTGAKHQKTPGSGTA
jgi:hypothetical protein